jgi:hypothetical protein
MPLSIPVPHSNVALVDPKTGLPTREWFDALKQIDQLAPLSDVVFPPAGVTSIDGVAGAFTLGYGLARTSQALRASLSSFYAALGADVALNNTANYFDGPSVAQGSTGTWFVSGTVTIADTTASVNTVMAKLWDGTTVLSSGVVTLFGAGATTIALSGIITSPAGNLRISARDASQTTGKIAFNNSGNSKDSAISAIRIA